MPPSLAILDDYAGIASKHFQPLVDQGHLVKIVSFPDTLNATKPEDLQAQINRLKDFEIISCMRERSPFPAELLKNLPKLKLLLSSGTRNAAIDLRSARERGIVVTGTTGTVDVEGVEAAPPKEFSAVNQHAWALLLSLASRIPQDDRVLKTGSSGKEWQSGLATSLGGKTLGVMGLGKLGIQMVRTAVLGFGMKVVAWSENLTPQIAEERAPGLAVRVAGSKEELLKEADVVSLHLVLSDRTRGIISTSELRQMKPSALLVNTSRGGLIDESALVEAVKEGRIGGVALDVFWEEPLPAESVWRKTDSWAKSQVVLSPHMGYVNSATLERWYAEQAEELARWGRGKEVRTRMG